LSIPAGETTKQCPLESRCRDNGRSVAPCRSLSRRVESSRGLARFRADRCASPTSPIQPPLAVEKRLL